MKIQVKKQISNSEVTFIIDEADHTKSMMLLAFITAPDYCHLDGFQGKPVKLEGRKVNKDGSSYTYIERKCFDDNGKIASSTMGEYKDGGGYFWHAWKIYDPTAVVKEISHEINQGAPQNASQTPQNASQTPQQAQQVNNVPADAFQPSQEIMLEDIPF